VNMNYEQARELLESHVERPGPEVEPTLLADALRVFSEHQFANFKGLSVKGTGAAPDWTRYEIRLSELGSKFELYLKAHTRIRGRNPLLNAIGELVADTRFGKGRDAFVSIVGDFGDASFVDVLKPLLRDPDVEGQALYAVTKLKIRGLDSLVEPLRMKSKEAWIRKAAEKYIQKYGKGKGPEGHPGKDQR
jgi:hypothetical protein